MKEWIAFLTENTIVINGLALLVIAIGTIEMGLTCLRAGFRPLGDRAGRPKRLFALCTLADSGPDAPACDRHYRIGALRVGRISAGWAAIAVIRTFLNYFLERDIRGACATEPQGTAEGSPPEAGVIPRR
jgi:hypothetical protein